MIEFIIDKKMDNYMKKKLKVFLLVIYIFLSNQAFPQRVLEIFYKGNWANLVIFLVIWLISVLGIFSVCFHPSKVIQRVGGLIIILFAFLGMIYLSIGGHFLNFEDLELLWISRAHASKAISFYSAYSYYPLFVLVIGFFAFFIPEKIEIEVSKALWTMTAFTPLLILMTVTYKKSGYGTKGMPMQYTTLSTFTLFQGYNLLTPGMNNKREPISISYNKELPSPDKILFLVDESIRSDYVNFQKKNTLTPYITEHLERFIPLGITASGNNCSAYSNAILRMGGVKTKLATIGTTPFIWSYAKKAGYKTYYIDGQLKNGELQNFMSGRELDVIDSFIQLNNSSEPEIDQKIATVLKEILNKKEKSFIYVNKRGAHFPYSESYNTAQARFLPQMVIGEKINNSRDGRIRLINSYKNAIYWNVDLFFKILLNGTKLDNTVIFYTSDHGQNLLDRGIQTHCNTVTPFFFEGSVPSAILTDQPKWHHFFKLASQKSKNHITHFQFFPTILQVMGYSKDEVTKRYGVGLDKPWPGKLEFSAGGLLPRFGKSVQWYPIKE